MSSSIFLVLLSVNAAFAAINSGSSYDDVVSQMFAKKECEEYMVNSDFGPVDMARSCGRATCNWPSEVCFESMVLDFNSLDQSTYVCRRAPDECLRAVGGQVSGPRPVTRPAVTRQTTRERFVRTTTESPISSGSSAGCTQNRNPGSSSCGGAKEWKYFYAEQRDRCYRFLYRGCGGNQNRFDTINDCNAACKGSNGNQATTRRPAATRRPVATTIETVSSTGQCSEPRNTGTTPCNQRARYVYYWTGSSCSFFRYSGCGGNSNQFRSRSECASACERTAATRPRARATARPSNLSKASCNLSFSRGNLCGSWSSVYYYDTRRKSCQSEWYGGCGGNANRFENIQACIQACM